MADKVDSLQQKTSALGKQLDEANRIVREISQQSPLASPQDHPTSVDSMTSPRVEALPEQFSAKDFFPPRESSMAPSPLVSSASQTLTSPSSPDMSATLAASSPRSVVPSPTPSERKRISEFSFGTGSRYSMGSYSSDEESTTTTGTHRYAYLNRPHSQRSNHASLLSRSTNDREPSIFRPDSSVFSHMLPPPAMDIPSLDHNNIEHDMSNLSLRPSSHPGISHLHRSATTSSQKDRFESAAIRNAAILCDV